FTREEIAALYSQHTCETGQTFDPEAVELIWSQTQGQPWLVNAVAREVIVKILQSDYTLPVTAPLAAQAIQNIILRRDTHIDSLLERLKEERVRKVIEPLITGDMQSVDKQSDDYHYVRDLGLIRDIPGGFEPSNPIYAEVIVRTLSYNTQDALSDSSYPYRMPRYLKNGVILT
ncbi:MAG: ATP-binding protein, partial [Tannerella sp.]|nr:ATP-binding protein [Tannerella sp.]